MNILSPLGSRAGRIEMTEERGIWKDGGGSHAIESNPRFGKFFQAGWSKELSYFLGLLSEKPRRSGRRVECHSTNIASDDSRQCHVEQGGDRLTLQFAFVEC